MSRLEKTANIVAIVTCVIAIVALVDNRLSNRSVTKAGAERQLIGKPFHMENAAWNQSQRSIVVAMKHSCQYCMLSMPLYRRLSDLRRDNPELGLFFISPDPLQETSSLLHDQGIIPTKIYEAQLPSVGVLRTPTLLVLDKNGIVRETLVGKLEARREQEFIATVTRPQ